MNNPYLDPVWVREALRRLNIRPAKGKGQNFLIDRTPLIKALETANITSNDLVIEVGPGLGVLTWELVQSAKHVICIELESQLAKRLEREFPAEKISVIESDILSITPSEILQQAGIAAETSYKFIANIPYAITSPLLRHFLEAEHPPELMIVLMQWEVAERICATDGKQSILSHAVQLYAEPEILMRVPARAFTPVPAVDSALVFLRTRPQRAVTTEPEQLFKTIRAGFSQARKKLSNSLVHGLAGQGFNKDMVLGAMKNAGIDANLRAEMLSIQDWAAITQQLEEDAAA